MKIDNHNSYKRIKYKITFASKVCFDVCLLKETKFNRSSFNLSLDSESGMLQVANFSDTLQKTTNNPYFFYLIFAVSNF